MTTTDLKPGDIVQHPEKGNGLVRRSRVKRDEVVVMQVAVGVDAVSVYDLTGWERVETCTERERTILDIYQRVSRYGYTYLDTCDGVVMERRRADEESTAQRAESTPPGDEKPMSATVTLFCPDCGEAENVTVVMLGRQSNGQRWFDLREFHAHTCPPAQPDEPTEFGARVTVTLPEGTPEKWLRVVSGDDWPWRNSDGDRHFWAYLIERGAVTLGWDE